MQQIDNLPDNVVGMRPVGRITADDIKGFVREIEDRLARHEKIGMVADVTQLEGITPAGMWEDLKAELSYLGKWHRFPNLAVISDGGFIASAATFVGKLLPQVEVRVFQPDQLAEATAFAARAGKDDGGMGTGTPPPPAPV